MLLNIMPLLNRLKRVPKGKFVCKACKEEQRWRLQASATEYVVVVVMMLMIIIKIILLPLLTVCIQVEKVKCKLLDLEAKQSDDCDTSEGDDSHGLQTQVCAGAMLRVTCDV
jgi:hypothetical protein